MLVDTDNCTAQALVWRENDNEDYFRACDRCEVWVSVDAVAHRAIRSLLVYDKRQDGNRGRTLLSPGIASLGLRAGDRLEPHLGLLDIGEAFDGLNCDNGPVMTLFWRPSREYMTRHRNPIFCPELGITPRNSLTVDLLHALYLGTLQDVAKAALWFLIGRGKWGVVGTLDERIQVAALKIRFELEQWLKSRRRSQKQLTAAHINAKKIGTNSDRKLKLKGAETYTFFLFLLHILEKDMNRWGENGLRYLHAFRHMSRMVDIFHEADNVMTAGQINASPPYDMTFGIDHNRNLHHVM